MDAGLCAGPVECTFLQAFAFLGMGKRHFFPTGWTWPVSAREIIRLSLYKHQTHQQHNFFKAWGDNQARPHIFLADTSDQHRCGVTVFLTALMMSDVTHFGYIVRSNYSAWKTIIFTDNLPRCQMSMKSRHKAIVHISIGYNMCTVYCMRIGSDRLVANVL